ncbi:MAG: nucleotidyl transferase AbiEii/AbiGii toxin family protein [Vulcanimicrobiota bacterium]
MKPDAFPGNLSPLQAELLKAFQGEGFFLTGGSALVGFYGHDRVTRDLDLFTRSHEAFEEGPGWLGAAVEALGASLDPIRTYPAFRRYQVCRGEEQTLVDLVFEPVPPVYPPRPIPGSRLALDLPDEIAVNKLCALVGRGEPRDLADLLFLDRFGVDLGRALELASHKDAGVGPDTLLLVLPAVPLSGDPEKLAALRDFRDDWIGRLRLEVLPPQ